MPAAQIPLIPRTKLFGNPDRLQPQISRDGRYLSWLAPRDGVMNVWLAPLAELDRARPLTRDTGRGIPYQLWAADNRHILYAQDRGGNENWHWYALDVESAEARDLTPIEGVNAMVVGIDRDAPDTLAVLLNDRDARWHDLWRISLKSGERQLIHQNSAEIASYVLDRQLNLRLAVRTLAEGGKALLRFEDGKLEELLRISHEDDLTTGPWGFNRQGDAWLLSSSIGRDTAALFRVDWASGAQTQLAEHAKANVGSVCLDAETLEPIAASFTHLTQHWQVLAPEVASDFAALKAELTGEYLLETTQTNAGNLWLITAGSAEAPAVYHVYDRTTRRLTKLFEARPQLKPYTLAPMHPEIIRSRDGLDLVSYLTVPAGDTGTRPQAPVPTVLLVHGGPWARDVYGYHPQHQWLANRGYAVLSVNFRGSSGLGKAFLNAGDLEWGRKMHDDLIDAVNWAIAEHIADPARIAIMGGSYGGYAALAGLAFTPDVFCCGVDIVGPSNLETLIATIPPYWASFFETFARRMGDPRTEAGRRLLAERSPLNSAARISKPLLIGQGANDPRVKQAESDQIVAAMRANGLPVTYVLYPDEGHGFVRPENRKSFNAITEAFLARHLGGRAEPIGEDLKGASLQVSSGADQILGLAEALAQAC